MAKRSLVVVESPTKVKTIQKYLDSKYIVKASMGHVRDLPKSKLGVDEKKGFKPEYKVLPAKKKVLDELKKAAEKVDALYIATDPDREGEAIGWHLAQELGISKAKTHRIMFNEITERAVKAAFLHPGKIDTNKVNAQQARRVLDRLVGYKLSPLLWEKIRRGLSAGRVQSVAVRLLTEREREIAAFVPVEYWSLHAKLQGKNPPDFIATLKEVRGEKAELPDEAATTAVTTGLAGATWTVKSVTRGERRRNPAPPFITSTLQQDANRKLHFTAKKTMMLAQQLYEGVELGEEGAIGLITYMRTDAVRVAAEAQEEAREWVTGRLGREYLSVLSAVKIQDFSKLDREQLEKLAGYEQMRGKLRQVMKSVEYPEGYFYVERTLALLFGLVGQLAPKQGLPGLVLPYASQAFMMSMTKPTPASPPSAAGAP